MHHILPFRLLQSISHRSPSSPHDRRHCRRFQLRPHFVLQLQRVGRRRRARGAPFRTAVDAYELQNHVDAVAAQFVETALIGSAVHRDAQLAERVEQVHFAHSAALRQRVQQILNVRATGENALHALANAVENRIVVDGGATEAGGYTYIEIGELLRDHCLHGFLKVYRSRRRRKPTLLLACGRNIASVEKDREM